LLSRRSPQVSEDARQKTVLISLYVARCEKDGSIVLFIISYVVDGQLPLSTDPLVLPESNPIRVCIPIDTCLVFHTRFFKRDMRLKLGKN